MKKILLAAIVSSAFFSASSIAENQNINVEFAIFTLADSLVEPLSYPATYQANSSNSHSVNDSLICTVPSLKEGETFDCGGTIYQGSGSSSSSLLTIETSALTDDEIENNGDQSNYKLQE